MTEENARNQDPRGQGIDLDIQKGEELARQRLEDPGFKFDEVQSMQCLAACLRKGEEAIERARGKDIICILGNTGAGKSTFINYVEGVEYEHVRVEFESLLSEGEGEKTRKVETRSVLQPKTGSKVPEIMKVSHSLKSETFVPDVKDAVGDLGEGVVWADCPGFLDSRGEEIKIANAINISKVLTAAKSMRVVVLINKASVDAAKSQGITELRRMIVDLFGGEEYFMRCQQRLQQSILVGISQAPIWEPDADDDPQKVPAEKVIRSFLRTDGLSTEAAEFLKLIKKAVFVFHPLDRADASWSKRGEVLSKLQSLSRFEMEEEKMGLALGAEEILRLEDIAGAFVDTSAKHLGKGEWSEARTALKYMNNVGVVDNPRVRHLLRTARNEVVQVVRRIKDDAAEEIRKAQVLANLDPSENKVFNKLQPAVIELGNADEEMEKELLPLLEPLLDDASRNLVSKLFELLRDEILKAEDLSTAAQEVESRLVVAIGNVRQRSAANGWGASAGERAAQRSERLGIELQHHVLQARDLLDHRRQLERMKAELRRLQGQESVRPAPRRTAVTSSEQSPPARGFCSRCSCLAGSQHYQRLPSAS